MFTTITQFQEFYEAGIRIVPEGIKTKYLVYKSQTSLFSIGEANMNQYILLSGSILCYAKDETPPVDLRDELLKQVKKFDSPLRQSLLQKQRNTTPVVIQKASLVTEIQKKFHIEVRSRGQVFLSNPFTSIQEGQRFGDCQIKKQYAAVAQGDCLVIEIIYDEKYWKWFAQRIEFWRDAPLVSACLFEQHFKMGTTIFRENDQSHYFYIMISGTVELKHGRVKISSLGNGQFFGCEDILLQQARLLTAVTTQDSVVYRIQAQNIAQFNCKRLQKLVLRRIALYDELLSKKRSNSVQVQSNIVTHHWLKDLTQVPWWNEQQMMRDVGVEVNSKKLKSINRVMPRYSFKEQPQQFPIRSMLEANTQQYDEMMKTYSRRMRSSKYADLHQCLQGQWDRIFKPRNNVK